MSRRSRSGVRGAFVAAALLLGCSAGITAESKQQYWATSLAGAVDEGILQGLDAAVARGEVGWLDVDPKDPVPRLKPGINLIFYDVGGNCYVGILVGTSGIAAMLSGWRYLSRRQEVAL
jgi:hypothetical protein